MKKAAIRCTCLTPLILLLAFSFSVTFLPGTQAAIYSETFDDPALDGKGAIGNDSGGTITNMTGVTNWTIDVSDAKLDKDDDWFMVRNSLFEGRDIGGEGIWESTLANISSFSEVTVSIDLAMQAGGGGMEDSDYINVYYQLDGGIYQVVSTNSGDFADHTARIEGISGNTLKIIVEAKNSSGDEYHRFDNVLISATPNVYINESNSIVPFATNSIVLTGVANNNVSGDMVWSNSLTQASGTFSASTAWTTPSIALDTGLNTLYVTGSNVVNEVSTDSIFILRDIQPPGSISVTITNPPTNPENVAYAVDQYDVQGTASTNLVGDLVWSNNLTQDMGVLPWSEEWGVSIDLDEGTNVFTIIGTNSQGATELAYDTANSYSPGVWTTGANLGDGFDPWEIVLPTTNNFSTTATNIFPDGVKAWELWSSGVDDSGKATASRPIEDTNMVAGTVFKWRFGNDNVNEGKTIGIALSTQLDTNLWEFYFPGGELNYVINDFDGVRDTGIPWTDQGIDFTFRLEGEATYSVLVEPYGESPVEFTGFLKLPPDGNNRIKKFHMWNDAANGHTYLRDLWLGTGGEAEDSVSIIREFEPEIPSITITNPPDPTTVAAAQDEIDVSGTVNVAATGDIVWTNALTGESGTIPAALSWVIPGIALNEGTNAITVFATNATHGAGGTLAEDVASNYGGVWNTGDNEGTGFEPWDLWSSGSGGSFIGPATNGTLGDVDTAGESFGVWGNPVGDNYGNARRYFSSGGLADGNQFKITLGMNYDDGIHGINFLEAGGSDLFLFDSSSGGRHYENKGAGGPYTDLPGGWTNNTGNGYAYDITITQLSDTEINFTVIRDDGEGNSNSFSQDFTVGNRVAGFQVYCGNNIGNPQNDLYFNKLKIVSGGASDTVHIYREAGDLPDVRITVPSVDPYIVPNSNTLVTVAGTVNSNAIGHLTWSNALTGGTGVIPVSSNWVIPNIPIGEGGNIISVSATNSGGAGDTDSTTVDRLPGPPWLAISNPPSFFAQVTYTATNFPVSGGCDSNTAGVVWRNVSTGDQGFTLPVYTNWGPAPVPLQVGSNVIVATGTNRQGIITVAYDSADDSVYNFGWTNGSTAGTGYMPWILNTNEVPTDRFAKTMAPQMSEFAWHMKAEFGKTVKAIRPFATPLNESDVVSLKFENGMDISSVGFSFQNEDDQDLLNFYVEDDTEMYYIWERYGPRPTGIEIVDSGLDISVSLTSPTNYVLKVTTMADGADHYYKGELNFPSSGTWDIHQLMMWNYFDGVDVDNSAYFTDMQTDAGQAIDFCTVFREPEDMPSVIITSPAYDISVDFYTTNYPVSGLTSTGTIGVLQWVNSLGGSGEFPSTKAWTNNFMLHVGANKITISGTNAAGFSASDSVTITRAAGCDPDNPLISVTNPATMRMVFPWATNSIPIQGRTTNVVGALMWTNTLTGEAGSTNATPDWIIGDIVLGVGENLLVLSGHEAVVGPRAWDSAELFGYDAGWTNGSWGGSGWAPWALAASGAAECFIASNSLSDIGSKAWGLSAEGVDTAEGVRKLDQMLCVGDVLSVAMDNSAVDTGGKVGMSLRTSSGLKLWEFYLVGGRSNYTVNAGEGETETTIAADTNGLMLTFALLGGETFPPTNYLMTVQQQGSDSLYMHAGSLIPPLYGRPDVIEFRAWNSGAGMDNDFYVNQLWVTNGVAKDALILVRGDVPPRPVWINELHYANISKDINEGFELAGPAGTDLSEYSLVLYDGSDSLQYNSRTLTATVIPNEESSGYGAVWVGGYGTNGVATYPGSGVALIYDGSNVVQFLSYGGATITASNGPAIGETSVDIGVLENSLTPIDWSLQLVGVGTQFADFAWSGPLTNSRGKMNWGEYVSFDTKAPGIPDVWWNRYFSTPTNASSGTDSDGDGYSNSEEFGGDSNPTNKMSYPHISAIDYDTNGLIYISFPSSMDRSYVMQYSTNLLTNAWTDITRDWIPMWNGRQGEDGMTVITETNQGNMMFWKLNIDTPGYP